MYDDLISSGKIRAGENLYKIGDEVYCELVDAEAKKANIYQNRTVAIPAHRDEGIENQWKNRWNADNFGPVIVPKDSFFVLGDNRNNARDSRYIGFIKKSDLLAVVL